MIICVCVCTYNWSLAVELSEAEDHGQRMVVIVEEFYI